MVELFGTTGQVGLAEILFDGMQTYYEIFDPKAMGKNPYTKKNPSGKIREVNHLEHTQ